MVGGLAPCDDRQPLVGFETCFTTGADKPIRAVNGDTADSVGLQLLLLNDWAVHHWQDLVPIPSSNPYTPRR